MSGEAAQPDDELAQVMRKVLAAGAAEGAEAAARRFTEAVGTRLDEIKDVLRALGAGTSPQTAAGSLSISLPVATVSVTAHVGSVQVTAKSGGAAASLSGVGTLSVSTADVVAAADELSVIRQADVEKLAGQPPVRWTKQQLVLNSLFLVAVALWLLPPAEQQYLVNMAILVTAVAAVTDLLNKP